MKNILAVVVFLITGFVAKSQTDSIKGNQYTLTGKIINQIKLPGSCGYFAFATVIEFEIIKFSDSTYSAKNIPVIITCPDFYGANFFEIGQIYEMTVADENQAEFGWTIINREILNNYKLKKRLWMISMKQEKNTN